MDNNYNILIADDEIKILEIVDLYLSKEGYTVYKAKNGEEALHIFENEKIDLVILDLMMPKLSGEEVCMKIRQTCDVPIIMLTAKSEVDDKLLGLSIGADDYVTKPFSARELVGRVHAMLRRSYKDKNPAADYFSFNDGDFEVDFRKMIVKKRGSEVKFTTNEFKILKVLLANPGQIFSRNQLVEKAFGFDYGGYDRTIDTHIKNIRQKIEDDQKNPKYIQTIYGIGYKFGGK
ncbi:DNA-binding response regulator, OmpR family, contains REC and winged-helix (wHTH) domain [Caloramator quimbayensis]|uniref:Stage 0 sporulation protein A homolog n=1 Tax=Caloramator quimbayensis TaxID=1147123 RepID=A0A1T4YCG8_9CLOT|nr:response regulator transcription factor [Caloramator quimbayensis]SKA98991.1 DNA-binding response regulator, OmpR family, contains REC and winged-helix (wHTH) domain [Caloramator quimbayensis]